MGKFFMKSVDRPIRFTFVVAFILGMVTHMYMFTNKFPNHDDVNQLYTSLQGLVESGRWFLCVPASFSGLFSMSWTNGLFGVLYLAFSACLITDTFRLKHGLPIVLMSASIVTFPSVCLTYTYMQCADAYFFSILLMTLAVWLINRYRWGFVVAFVPVLLSLAIYQAYFGFGLALAVFLVIYVCITGRQNPMDALLLGIKAVCAFGVGMAGYLVSVKVSMMLAQTTLTAYQGLDTMGQISLHDIWPLIQKAYSSSHQFYVNDSFRFFRDLPDWFGAVCALVGLIELIAVVVLKKTYKQPLCLLLTVFCMIVFPLAAGIIWVMSNNESVHGLMIYGYVVLFICMAIMLDILMRSAGENESGKTTSRWMTIAKRLLATWAALMLLVSNGHNFVLSNGIYGVLGLSYEQGYSYALRLVIRIEECGTFEKGDTVYLVGRNKADWTQQGTAWMKDYVYTGTSVALREEAYTRANFLKNYMGLEAGVTNIFNRNQLENLGISDMVDQMPVYPAEGSVMDIDGKIIVKLGTV